MRFWSDGCSHKTNKERGTEMSAANWEPQARVEMESQTDTGPEQVATLVVPLTEYLMQAFDVFECCKIKWGLVTDVRADGSTFQRHGLIVQLTVDVENAIGNVSRCEWKCSRIRQGIDLVKLALAVDPRAILPLLLRKSQYKSYSVDNLTIHPDIDDEEIKALAGGDAPFELRLRLTVCTKEVHDPEWGLVKTLMRELDELDVNESFANPSTVRSYLVKRAQSTQAARRLIDLPVQAKLTITPYSESRLYYNISEEKSETFFENWAQTTEALHLYQDGRANTWQMENHHAPLVIESIMLDLSSVPVTAGVTGLICAMASKGLFVSAKVVNLDIRLVTSWGSDLTRFLQTITEHSKRPLVVYTGPTGYETMPVLDQHGENFVLKTLLLLRSVGQLEHEIKLELGNLLLAFETPVNRHALARGLFDFVFLRAAPTSLYFFETQPTDEDRILLEDEAARWRLEHPDKKICLRSLMWSPDTHNINYVRTLLRVVDDIEEATFYPEDGDFSAEDLETLLRYPSLRRLHIGPVEIPTMDIFDVSADGQSRPALELLELNGVTLLDQKSMVPFMKRLDPSSPVASVLSRTLHTLSIAENNPSIRAREERGPNSVRLALNDPDAVPALRDALVTNNTLQIVNIVGNFSHVPVWPGQDSFPNPLVKSHIPAPAGSRRGKIVNARNAAFLSAVQDGNCVTMRCLDSNLVRVILSFSVPHTYRKIRT